MGKNRRTARHLTGLERESELLGLMNQALASNLGSYAGQFSQLYGNADVPTASSNVAANSWPFHDIGSPNDVLVPKGDALQRMSELLSLVTHQAGEYSFGGEAKTLPVMPGLALKEREEVISLPVQTDNSENLLKYCTKEGEKVWVLPGDRVEMKNPEWSAGIEKLSEHSAARMGYKGVAMTIVLSKVMVIGERGGLQRQQDPDENDRCIAKLVVRLPSKCTGGDLVVHEEGTKNMFRYTLGGQKGMAAFKPHYGLYTAGTLRTFEEVTSGFSLMLVYSLCLPPELPFVRGSSGSDLLRMGLAEAMMKFVATHGNVGIQGENVDVQNLGAGDTRDENLNVALILSTSFQLQNLTVAGAGVQANLDVDRLSFFIASNAILPPEKQFRFYVAKLQYAISDSYSRWDHKRATESATWYTIRGEKLDGDTPTAMNWTKQFNFLNPEKETLGQLWKNGEGELVFTYERYAIVGWPTSVDIMNTHVFMGEVAAAASVFMDNPVEYGRLQKLLKYEACQYSHEKTGMLPPHIAAIAALNNTSAGPHGGEYGNQGAHHGIPTVSKTSVSLTCCQHLCKAIFASDDVTLVDVFLRKYFASLKQKHELVPLLADIVQKFGWEGVSAPFVRAFDGLSHAAAMSLALHLADSLLDMPLVRAALTIMSVQKAGFAFATCPEELVSSSNVRLLWKHSMACRSQQIFLDVASLFMRLNAKIMGPVVDALAKCVAASATPEHHQVLISMASRRRQWLMEQIAEAEKPFGWEVVDMNFVGAAGMVTFLDGPNTSYQVRCFKGLDDAHKRMALLREKIRAPLKMTVGGRGRDAYVLVVKQAGKFTKKSQDIHKFKSEIYQLNQLLAVDPNSSRTSLNTSTANGVCASKPARSGVIAATKSANGVRAGNATSPAATRTTGTKRPRKEPDVIVIE